MWQCPKCETKNDADVCVICGEKRPQQLQIQRNIVSDVQKPKTAPILTEHVTDTAVKKEKKDGKNIVIAVLITIIVMLIIGGVVFAVFGNGVFYNKADDTPSADTSSEYVSNDAEKTDSAMNAQEVLYIDNGDSIIFGNYEQDNNLSNGKEPIEWIVLERKGDRVFVISKYALDCMQYNTVLEDVTWETCSLRRWLNNEFINTTFSEAQKNLIVSENVSPGKNPKSGTDCGSDTEDKVFLLNYKQAYKYFDSDVERACMPTEYAQSNGVWVYENSCLWWLCTPGENQENAMRIIYNGGSAPVEHGYPVDGWLHGVRPALWINLK